MRCKSLFVIATCAFSSVPAFAVGDKSFVGVAVTQTQNSGRADDVKSESDVTIINASLGFNVGNGFSLGVKYFDYSSDDKVLEDENMVISGYGPMAAYMHTSGFYGTISYLLSPTKTYKAAKVKSTYEGGNGYVVDFGKFWDVGSNFGVGFAITQSKVTYKKVTVGSNETDLSGDWSDSSLYPYASFFIFF